MRTLGRLFLYIFLFILVISMIGVALEPLQPFPIASVPPDPNEPVKGNAKVLTNPQERSAALQLLDRARQNYTFNGPHSPAYTMKVSFTSNGQLPYEGQGSMQETWVGHAWRWSAKIGSTETLRVGYGGQVWSDNPLAPVPLRIQMVRTTLMIPVVNPPTRVMLRSAPANINGRQVTCILTSGEGPDSNQPRNWVEKEFCIDPENGNLLVWSEAPGHFVFYDYTSSTEFQGHVVANDISIYEAGNRVMQIHMDSIEDASAVNPKSLQPTPQMMASGPSFVLSEPAKFPVDASSTLEATIAMIQPVIIHATIDREGDVMEAEALSNSHPELTAQAIEFLKSHNQGRSRVQREAFVNVHVPVSAPPTAGQ